MTDAEALLAAIDQHPGEFTPRGSLADLLMESGRWGWETVLGFVLANPASDGRRYLAADYLESDAAAVPCGTCGGTGWTTHQRLSMVYSRDHTPWLPGFATVGCLPCGGGRDTRGTGRDPGPARRGEFIRVQCELAADPSCRGCHGTGRLDADHRPGTIECRSCDPWGSGKRGLYDPLRRRERELWELHGRGRRDEWGFAVPDRHVVLTPVEGDDFGLGNGDIEGVFRRGFVDGLTLSAADLPRLDAVLAAQPVSRVTLTTVPDVDYEIHPPGVRARVRFVGEEWWASADPANGERGAILGLLAFRWPQIPPDGWTLPVVDAESYPRIVIPEDTLRRAERLFPARR